MKTTTLLVITFAYAQLAGYSVRAQDTSLQQHVAALKDSLEKSKQSLKKFEWIETTEIDVKGEKKSEKMERCYYGLDGKVQKVPVTAPPPEEQRRGLRGRIAERRTEEMTDYMHEVVALVKSYVPPDPALIQRSKDLGNLSISPKPENRVLITLTDFIKGGDSISFLVDLSDNRPISAEVSTFLDSSRDAVNLKMTFGKLENKASYVKQSILNVPSKELRVVVANSGYRPQSSDDGL